MQHPLMLTVSKTLIALDYYRRTDESHPTTTTRPLLLGPACMPTAATITNDTRRRLRVQYKAIDFRIGYQQSLWDK
jgi:hypothetical protein